METARQGSRRKKRVKLRPMKTPNLNPDAMSHWIRHDTIMWCKIENDSCFALLDTSMTINIITADSARILDLPMGPLSDLREGLQGVKVKLSQILKFKMAMMNQLYPSPFRNVLCVETFTLSPYVFLMG